MATIEARITKVEHDMGSGWYSILTDHPDVRKLTTKMDPKAREAAALRQSGEVALIRYSHKTRTDETSGRTYNNYYYEQAATVGPAARNDNVGIDTIEPTQTAVTSTGRAPTPPEDAWRMAKTSGSERAVQTLPLMPTEQRTFEVQKQIALAWAQWIMDTPKPGPTHDGNYGETHAGRGAYDEPEAGGYYEPPPPRTDDDIPY